MKTSTQTVQQFSTTKYITHTANNQRQLSIQAGEDQGWCFCQIWARFSTILSYFGLNWISVSVQFGPLRQI